MRRRLRQLQILRKIGQTQAVRLLGDQFEGADRAGDGLRTRRR
jgi:hypothetical protein